MEGDVVDEQARSERENRLARMAPLDIVRVGDTKGQLRYDGDRRFVQAGVGRYETIEAMVSSVANVFPSERVGNGIRGRMTRDGKYERVSASGERIFTFGDPILDAITDDRGHLQVGGRELNIYAADVGAADRNGGISSIGFTGNVDRVREALAVADLSAACRFTVLEDDDDELILASRNPDKMWFYRGSTCMRFRAFRKSYAVYIKMGADIETWGQDFRRASISSTYGSFLDDHGHCFAVDSDSDSDTDDDYVDEYEWFLGGGVGSGLDGVRSSCVATWHDRVYPGTVEYGCVIADI
jgi:hypothetical protein